jgi:PBP1b-binding outer membrane lipoprotein LpoB
MKKLLTIILTATFLQGCATAVAVVDVTASTAIYAGKTVVNTIDAVTPDIVN